MKGIFGFDGLLLNPCANIDGDWGPYESVPAAMNTLSGSLKNKIGRRFGVKVYDRKTFVG